MNINTPNSTQCNGKFYSLTLQHILKTGYRHFLDESKKTDNRRPKPFYFETEIACLLQGDPAFKPPIVESPFGMKEINKNGDHRGDINDDDVVGESKTTTANATSSCSISKKKRTTFRTNLGNIFNRGTKQSQGKND